MNTNAVSRQQAKIIKQGGRYVIDRAGNQRSGTQGTERPGRAAAPRSAARTKAMRDEAAAQGLPQTAVRTGFLIEALGSGAEVARLLGVNRSQPSQWRSGKESPSPKTARQLLDLDYVVAKALQIWPAATALEWFHGSNDYLDGARPIDVLKRRGTTEIIKALDLEMA